MIKDKKQMFIVIGVFTLVMLLGTVTYAFFNYTRTGQANNIRTGRIYFNSSQDGRLQLTNVFPVKSADVDEDNLDSVTVAIQGDTTYDDGEEFEISLVNVVNTVNGKRIPINYIATYVANTGASIGESSDDYWNARHSKDANIYTLTSTGQVKEGKQVLVGYIDNGAIGINGTLTIKAYIDADRIAISDTYPEKTVYTVKTAGYSAVACETALTGATNAESYCASADALQDAIDNENLIIEQITLLVNAGLVTEYTNGNGTTSDWVHGRTVFTTSEWNSLQSTPISFKIRAESNEGLWVEEPGKIDSCPDCKFIYNASGQMFATWNTHGATPTEITSGYSTNYNDIVEQSGKNYFLGVITNGSNQIERAFACGLKDEMTPFCIEGTSDGSKYNNNSSLINGASLWANTCDVGVAEEGTEGEYEYTHCGELNNGSVSASADSLGTVFAGVGDDDACYVNSYGDIECSEPNYDTPPDPQDPQGPQGPKDTWDYEEP